MLRLYKALVWPNLEYCEQIWTPYLRKGVLALERVQSRFTRMIPGISGLVYHERLTAQGLYSLEFRRLRRDLLETYRILKGINRVDMQRIFPQVGESSLRIKGHSFRKVTYRK